jgi:predicted DNA-binding transcriptional regulator
VKQLLSESFLVVVILMGTIVVAYIYYVKNHKGELREIEKTIEHNAEKIEKKEKHSKKK